MSDDLIKLNEEIEKVRLNSIKMLKMLGYKNDATEMTQEQIDARIEILMEKKQNQTGDSESLTPTLFTIDEERENKDAVKKSKILTFDDLTTSYDALTAQIPQLRNNSQVGHYEGLAARENIRILRLPASIKLDENHSIIKRVVL